ncbi:beta-1,3-galactosyltransferase 2-like [Hyperolius riggenbachi]|uniref:beta-1,3-galactosyltransferase 2-like n=1 Tax=Hyperolius riggenbachi TaxID=752182 RepID=UPI0035A29B7A
MVNRRYTLLALFLLFFFGVLYHFQNQKSSLISIFSQTHFTTTKLPKKENQRPVNNQTYPAFRHPLAPPYPYPYEFLINQPDKCKDRTPFLVILISGRLNELEARNAIRATWGNESNYDVDVLRLFSLGFLGSVSDRTQLMLEEESKAFGDIIQQDFMDTSYNLTLKSLMGIEWVTKFCPKASYAIKTDNDMFLNVDYLVHKLLHPELPVRQNYITGLIVSGTAPSRNKAYKYYLPTEVYPNNTFPTYCAGSGYVFSADMAQKMYDISQEIRVIPIEDAFNGICLHELHIPPTIPPQGIFNGHHIQYNRCQFHKLITAHQYTSDQLRSMWQDFWTLKSSGCT